MKITVFMTAFMMIAINFSPTSVVASSHNGGFLNGLFNNGQRARDRQAAAHAAEAQRRENRQIQTALLYFGFDVGVVDGIVGKNTRSAIRAYQQAMGFASTGRLETSEQDFLLSAYTEFSNGNSDVNWQILANSEGALGLLKALYLGENPIADGVIQTVEPDQNSMRAFCVNLEASGDIELVKAQFCNLRQLAIDQANILATSGLASPGLSIIDVDCAALAEKTSFAVNDIRLGRPEEIKAMLMLWQQNSGMSQDQLKRLARICLGTGYAFDDAQLALVSALVLSGLDEAIYTELTGYHLAFGIGYAGEGDYDLAKNWVDLAAQEHLQEPFALTGQSGEKRSEILADIGDILAVAR